MPQEETPVKKLCGNCHREHYEDGECCSSWCEKNLLLEEKKIRMYED